MVFPDESSSAALPPRAEDLYKQVPCQLPQKNNNHFISIIYALNPFFPKGRRVDKKWKEESFGNKKCR